MNFALKLHNDINDDNNVDFDYYNKIWESLSILNKIRYKYYVGRCFHTNILRILLYMVLE